MILMDIEQLRDKVKVWNLQIEDGERIADSKYGNFLAQIDHFARTEWKVYLPAEHPDFNPSYLERLAGWIGNVSDENDQKLLLEYALYISFFSRDDFNALYRTAFEREITRWVAQQADIQFYSTMDDFQRRLQNELYQKTWFCPVTDSMDINEFYHINHIQGVGHRPCFYTLQHLSETAGNSNCQLQNDILKYMNCPTGNPSYPALERIVLLEDFVGSGTQCLKAIQWAIKNLDKNVLFVPLILCPNGAKILAEEQEKYSNKLAVRPIIELQRSDLLGDERQGENGWPITEKIEEIVRKNIRKVSDRNIHPFGYKGTGSSVVTFSNTPDNTPPFVHHKSSSSEWKPLFPRVFRD
jgi:hypothetical protein